MSGVDPNQRDGWDTGDERRMMVLLARPLARRVPCVRHPTRPPARLPWATLRSPSSPMRPGPTRTTVPLQRRQKGGKAQHAEMRRKPAAGPPTQSPPTGRRLNHSDCSTRPSRRGTHPPAASPSRARLPAPKRWSSAFPASPAPPARRTAARPRAARRRPPPPRGRRRREGCRRLGGAAWRPVQGGGTPSLAGGPPGRWRRRGNGRAGR